MAEYINENFVSTYLKVGTFQIVGGQKQGGNVASYFCLGTGEVIHAIAGKVDAPKMMSEARWAYETRKAALTHATRLAKGPDLKRYADQVKKSHTERFHEQYRGQWAPNNKQPMTLPASMPRGLTQQAQTHWHLANRPLVQLDDIYPIVWTQVLNERLSTLPVAQR